MSCRFIIVALALTSMVNALAWSGPLQAPSVVAPRNCPQPVFDRVLTALNRKDATFLDGFFFGANFNTMRFRGNTQALNGLLADLAQCPGMALSIGFSDGAPAPKGSTDGIADWSITSSSASTNFDIRVVVNVRSERIALSQIKIPTILGAPIPPAPGELIDSLIKPGREVREPLP